MKARRQWFGMFVLLGLISALVIGCGADAPAPTATPLPAPTLAPTTAPTVAPPTQASAASSSMGGTLLDALGKAKDAASYRVALSITGRGNFAAEGEPTPAPGTENEPITLVQMTGEVNGKDGHFTMQGLLTSFLGIDPANAFEVVSFGGESFLKGPVPLLGADEAKWYKAPAEAASVAQPPLTPSSFLEAFGEAGIDPADFTLAGTESLDGQECQVYAGDKAAVVSAFSKIGGATGATQEDLDTIDAAEFKFWVCPDGYVHQIKMAIEGHEKDNPDDKGAFEILMKISDFDSAITITPPADAEPLTLPTFGATPTP